jgi:phosphoketolase
VRGIGDTHVLGRFLRDVAKQNSEQRNFRIFGPDETLSNGLEALLETTQRQWEAATGPNDEFLAPQTEHPHGLCDTDFDELFTRDKPVIFAFHGYPWLIHRLTYRRTNHDNIHVRGYKEEGTITTPFDMTVLNDLDRFHLVMDTIDRLPQTGAKGVYLKQQLKDNLIEHKQYIDKYGEDLLEIRHWKWGATNGGKPA